MIARTIATGMHGRYLVEPPSTGDPAPMLAGFHGYAEPAEAMMTRLRSSVGADRWLCVAVQGLNRFYQRRTDEVIAGWMTRQDRELAIADNIAYAHAVLEAIGREWMVSGPTVLAGFSQGTAMAFHAAAALTRPPTGVIAVGGDIPPEIPDAALGRCGTVLLCRGRTDEWYTEEKFAADTARLHRAGVFARAVEFDGGHEWNAVVVSAVSDFLAEAQR